MSQEPDFSDLDQFMSGDPYDPVTQEKRLDALEKRGGDADARVRELMEKRRRAYVAVLRDGNAEQYQRDIVMADIQMFCRGGVSVFHENSRTHAYLSGRQELWLRIQDHLGLPLDDLLTKYEALGRK